MASGASVSLKEYLKRYETGEGDEREKKKRRKKRKEEKRPNLGGVLIVDEDPTWQKPVVAVEEENHSSGDDMPIVDEDIEVKRLRRLQMIQAQKPYLSISEDGSGWVSVSEDAKRASDLSHSRNLYLSPPRQNGQRRFHSPSTDSRSHGRNDSPSPPAEEGDLSPPRKVRHDSPEIGMSPRASFDDDISPPRRNRKGSSSDNIFPMRRGRRFSPKKSHVLRGSEADLSPPRKNRRVSNDDISPPRRKARNDHRSPEHEDADLSPPRRSNIKPVELDRKGGLFTGGEIKEVIDRKKAEALSRIAALDPTKSGKGAEPVYRNQGKRVSKEEKLKLQKGEEKPKEIKLEWGKGLAQKREAEARQKALELEKEKPFARTRDDPDLDKMLKERLRWGDPMAHLVKSKHSDILLEDLGDDEKMKESGFIIPQAIPSHSWIKRGIDPPSNRYNIRPGRHWDGVDRSTGYEKELFKRQNEKRATQTEAYLWSVSDM